MQKTFCDRCGELIAPEQMHYFYKGTLSSSKRPTPNTWVGTEPETIKVDLCQACFDAVWPLEKITRQNADEKEG